jgi:hypothetical protein
MSEIKTCHVITRNPSGGRGDLGSCEVGYYTVSDDLLAMVGGDGGPLRDANNGERITHRLVPGGESEKAVAMRLTLKLWLSERGDEMAGFNRPIDYGRSVY